LLIAHTSDFHVFSDRQETSIVRSDAVDAARKVIADIVDFSPQIDAVMITGDLTDGGSQEDYALLKDLLSPITVPIFVVPGNHDSRDRFRAAFEDTLPFGHGPYLDYEAICGDLRIIALDTLIEGQIYGGLDDIQISWLADRLASYTDRLTIVLMHHPAFPSTIKALDQMTMRVGHEEFTALIDNYAGPLRILSGHIHRPFQTLWNGRWCSVSGGPAFQRALKLTDDAQEPSDTTEPFSYFIHRIDDHTAITVHTRYLEL